MLLRDAYLVLKNLPYLPAAILCSQPTDKEVREKYSEDRYFLKVIRSKLDLFSELVFGDGWFQTIRATVFDVGSHDNDDEVWFFVNGFATRRALATRNALLLAKMFKRKITVVHNPSHGVPVDLFECIYERTFNINCPISNELYEQVFKALTLKKKVKVIGHSQGGIIIGRTLLMLKALEGVTEPDFFKNLEVFTFASASDEDVQVAGAFQEHFANSDDFVARVGVIYVWPDSGLLHMRKERGHLLSRDYLEHVPSGKFCEGKSRLFGYAKRATDSETGEATP
jgi:hypothetical protein